MANLLDYTGAGSRLTPAAGLALPSTKWAWSPKLDGVYCRATTDAQGRIVSTLGRNGSPIREGIELHGILAGPPSAVLHGELEAHTEASARAVATRGYRLLHLFDCTRAHGRSIEREPYQVRYGAIHRAHTDIELAGLARIESLTPCTRTWLWSAPTDSYLPPSPKLRPWSPKGTMVPGGPPFDLRRVPVVPLLRGPSAASSLWREYVELGGGEGLVAVKLAAPAGAQGSKRKIKATDTITARVVVVDGSSKVALAYGGQVFHVGATRKTPLSVGQLVDVAHDGWYERGATPRFARVVRVRTDLE